MRSALLAAFIALFAAASWELRGRMRAQTLVDALLHTPTSGTPELLGQMAEYRRWVNDELARREPEVRQSGDERQRLHISLAMVSADEGELDYVRGRLLAGTPEEVVAIRRCLRPYASTVADPLWDVLQRPPREYGEPLRAACFLAEHFPHDPRWGEASETVADRLASANFLLLKEWTQALQPVAGMLLEPMAHLASRADSPERLQRLSALYAELAAGRPQGFAPLEAIVTEPLAADGVNKTSRLRRKGTAAAALSSAGRWEHVRPLLKDSDDRTLRTYVIESLVRSGISPQEIARRIDSRIERDPAVQEALVLVLGEMADDRTTRHDRQRMAQQLSDRTRRRTDPGLDSAMEWLSKRWGIPLPREDTGSPGADGPHMVVVGRGEFLRSDQRGSPRRIKVERDFALATREVTVAEYLRFDESHMWDKRASQTLDSPVNEVSWYDAAAYCNWLSDQLNVPKEEWCYAPNDDGEYADGMKIRPGALGLAGFRLPTADEWELASRARSVTRWSFGDAEEMLNRYAWSMANSGVRARPVGLLRPNRLGFFDMYGNVWEWCHDRVDSQGSPAPVATGEEEVVGGRFYRPLRGGTYLNDPATIGPGAAIWNPPGYHTGADGFRVARSITGPVPSARDE